MPWERRYFKKKKVWVKTTSSGNLAIENNRVPIRYQNDKNAKVYMASPRNVSDESLGEQIDELNESPTTGKQSSTGDTDSDEGELNLRKPQYLSTREQSTDCPPELLNEEIPPEGLTEIHTDGACSKSSGAKVGQAGLGVVIRTGEDYLEISQYLGRVSNQVAELAAILVGLEAVKADVDNVKVITDSKYAQGMIENRWWEAKANKKLVRELRTLADEFASIDVEWVKGHAGHPLNERADDLAVWAVEKHRND